MYLRDVRKEIKPMSLKAYIVDDERLARENLKILISSFCPEVDVLGEASNITDAEACIRALQPDVLFLDIRMPSDAEGFVLLDNIKDLKVLVVFVTAFKDYAMKAFNANAAYYVLKPVDVEELQMAVEKVKQTKTLFANDDSNYVIYQQTLQQLSSALQHNTSNGRFAISHTKGLKIVEEKNVVYLQAEGNCTMLFFKDGTKYLDTRTLKIYESILDDNNFFRVHKSYIVNIDFIQDYIHSEGHYVILKNKIEIPVARNRVQDFVKTLKGA